MRLSVSFKPTLVGLLFVLGPSPSSLVLLLLPCPFFKVCVALVVAVVGVEPEFDRCWLRFFNLLFSIIEDMNYLS
jgi:hypothetical protein